MIRSRFLPLIAVVVVLAIACILDRDAFTLDLLFTFLLYAVLGQSWNWISGYGGQISFGHAIFFACGAYGFEIPVANGFAAMQFSDKRGYVALGIVLFALVQFATILLEGSRLGYYLRALRLNHDTAAAIGIDERRTKLVAFAISSTFAAVAGVLYAQYTLFVDPPSTLAIGISIDIALVGVVGGIGTLWGPVVGALVYVFLARGVALQLGGTGKGYDLVIYGALICIIAAWRPHGIVGSIVDAIRRRRSVIPT